MCVVKVVNAVYVHGKDSKARHRDVCFINFMKHFVAVFSLLCFDIRMKAK